jgi:hypothetical protein
MKHGHKVLAIVVVHARQVFESQGLVAFSSVASCSSVLLLR